jgi:hypothetical protein
MKRLWNLIKAVFSVIGVAGRAFIALIGIVGITAAVANYTMTQGSGTTFASVVISTVHYAANVICDAAAGTSQCASVDAFGQQKIDVNTSNNNLYTAVTSAIPTGANAIGSINGTQSAAVTMQSAATGNANGTGLSVGNYGTAIINVNCTVACSGGTTINFEGTDSTGTYYSTVAFPVGGGAAVTTATTSGVFWVPTGAWTTIRARISGYSAGTITVTGQAVFGDQTAVLAAIQGSVSTNNATNVTATDCSGTISSGGAAQNAFTAQTTLHGFTIMNIDTTEPLWISFTTTAAASGSGSYALQAATATTFAGPGTFTTPAGFGLNHALSVIAATTSHKFTCTWW